MSTLRIFATLCLMLPAFAIAQVTHVTLWDPLPGKSAEMLTTAAKGVALNIKLGAQPGTAIDTHGRLHFIMSFDSWAAWGEHQAKAAADPEMRAFIAEYTANPRATMVESFMLEQPIPGAPGAVYNVFVWEAYEGRSAELMTKAVEASDIHKKAGAGIAVNVDQLGRMHYVMSFDSWSAWGKFQDAPTAEWAAFMGGFQADPPGKIVQTFMANELPQ